MGVALRIGHVGLAAILAAQGAAPTSLAAQPTGRAPYTASLAQAAALTPRELAQEQRQFMAWLQTNGASLPPDQLQGAREHLYFLVGSAARAQLRATGRLFPPRDTLGLAEMLDEGTRLGLPGAGVVARALIGAAEAEHLAPPVLAAAPFRLSFSAPEYTLRSAHGWSVRFPYYFMISHAETTTPKNDVETDVVMLSTLFGRHRDRPGGSQATILLVATSPTGPDAVERFVRFWLGETRITEKDAVADALVADSRHYRQYDTVDMMDKEIVTLQRGQVVMIVEYIGVPGTFEANRQDFLDVVRGLHFTGSK